MAEIKRLHIFAFNKRMNLTSLYCSSYPDLADHIIRRGCSWSSWRLCKPNIVLRRRHTDYTQL